MNISDIIHIDDKNLGSYSIDNLRGEYIDTLIIHHSAGNDLENRTDEQVIKAISDMHKKRFYKNGEWDSRHDNWIKDERVYCAYHFIMWPHHVLQSPGSIMRPGWRVTPTMKGFLYNVAGGTKSYPVNKKAIQVCVLGDYSRIFPKHDFIDSFIKFFSPLNDYIKQEYDKDLKIHGHKDFGNTVCPGTLYDLIPKIREVICG